MGVQHSLNLTQDVLRRLVKICGRGWGLLSCHGFFKQQTSRIKFTHEKILSTTQPQRKGFHFGGLHIDLYPEKLYPDVSMKLACASALDSMAGTVLPLSALTRAIRVKERISNDRENILERVTS